MAGANPLRSHHVIILFLVFSKYQNILCDDDDSDLDFDSNAPTVSSSGEQEGFDRLLIRFKQSLKNSDNLSWNESSDPCQWNGINCNPGREIVGIDLIGMNLAGDSLDFRSLENITSLRGIYLQNNSFSGSIPALNSLFRLKFINLSENRFSGEIPDHFFNPLKRLRVLYLSSNNFSGNIPSSLKNALFLKELLLNDNSFSGYIPDLKRPSLEKLNLSKNDLEGRIPDSLKRFGDVCFTGNPKLCGTPLSIPCTNVSQGPDQGPPDGESGTMIEYNKSSKWIMLTVLILVLTASYVTKKPQDPNSDTDTTFCELEDEMLPMMFVDGSRGRTVAYSYNMRDEGDFEDVDHNDYSSTQRPKADSSMNEDEDLVMVNDAKGEFGLQNLMKAASELIGSDGLGTTYRSIMSNGLGIVVKRFREMDRLDRDQFDTEVRRLGAMNHPNVLPPLAYYYQDEEKFLVFEYVRRGSLLSVLHGTRGVSYTELDWLARLKIIKGIARGLGFLHTEFPDYELPHGNLKSSNILLTANNDPLLIDYAMHQLIGPTPEVQESLFAYKCPEAHFHDYLTPKFDVYCFGIVILEIVTGEFPCHYSKDNQKDGLDLVQLVNTAIAQNRLGELIDPEISSTAESLEGMLKMFYIAASCVEDDFEKRIEMREAIRRIEEIEL